MAKLVYDETGRLLFTKEMQAEYTILMPQMLPIHQTMMEVIFRRHGIRIELLRTNHQGIVTEGLQSVHNDTCYPALLSIGQLMDAVKSGIYDTNRIAVMITQTGGGCRASNYIHLLRKALKRHNLEHIPVVSFSIVGMEKNPGFVLTPKLIYELAFAVAYGDLLMAVSNQIRPYELEKGRTDALVWEWVEKLTRKPMGVTRYRRDLNDIMRSFADIPMERTDKIKVGVVGEIYVKYAPLGNNNLEAFLQSEGVEVIVPGLLNFIFYSCNGGEAERQELGIRNWGKLFTNGILQAVLRWMEAGIVNCMRQYKDFTPLGRFEELKGLVQGYSSQCNKMGEGWLLTAEMLELLHGGVHNIVCTQPFGCLPNHIVGKGMIRKIRETHPEASIVAIDYDPGATRVNQENRIKLMLSSATLSAQTPERLSTVSVLAERLKTTAQQKLTAAYDLLEGLPAQEENPAAAVSK